MPIKKCAYCGERMNRVIYGLPTAEDFAVPRPFTEFAGCIIDGLAEDYKCPTCDSKIIKTISPETGACLAELPPKQRQALEIFAKRIQNALVPLGEEEDRVSIQCPHELEDVDSESDWFAGLQFEHNLRGDLLRIKICDCQELTIPLGDGPAILESRGITAYDPWDIRTTYSRTEITDIDVNLSKDHLSELLVWQQPLREVVKATLYARKCDRDYCSGRNDAAEEVIFSEEVDWPTVAYGQSPPAGWLDSRRRELAVEREED